VRDLRDCVAVRVLLVEDDRSIAEPLLDGLDRHGFETLYAATGEAALAAGGDADLVLLDLGLPDLEGGEVCRRLRSKWHIPIIVVSARSDEVDRVLLLEMGADDYVVKPFSTRELIARIRAVARRSAGQASAQRTLVAGPLRIDERTHTVWIDDRVVELTPKEFGVLAHLAGDPGAVHGRREILEQVWDQNWFGSSKTLDVHVASLRRKLGHPEWIQAIRGVGFRLAIDDLPATATDGP
jgi:two-component system, OmpR family, response regulator RegX3